MSLFIANDLCWGGFSVASPTQGYTVIHYVVAVMPDKIQGWLPVSRTISPRETGRVRRSREVNEGAGNRKWKKEQETESERESRTQEVNEGAGDRKWTKEQETGSERESTKQEVNEGAGNRTWVKEQETGSERESRRQEVNDGERIWSDGRSRKKELN